MDGLMKQLFPQSASADKQMETDQGAAHDSSWVCEYHYLVLIVLRQMITSTSVGHDYYDYLPHVLAFTYLETSWQ